MKKALVFGASGLIGSFLLEQLLNDSRYGEVLVFVRRKLERQHPKLQQHVVDFEHPDSFGLLLQGDELYCCIGTTRRKTPSLDAYRKIDLDLPAWLAKTAKQNGIGLMLVVSSLGANAGASNFYAKIKGEMEEQVKAAGVARTVIVRPSMLLGPRQEFRFGELVGKFLVQLFFFLVPPRYRAIHAATVARAMIKAAGDPSVNGVLESEVLRKMGA